jgi:hypothetical protein
MRRALRNFIIMGGSCCVLFSLVPNNPAKDEFMGASVFSLGLVIPALDLIRTRIRHYRHRRIDHLYKAMQDVIVHPQKNEATLAKLLSKQNKSPEDLLIIGQIYSDLGNTVESEKYAQDAVTALEGHTDPSLYEIAVYTLAMLWTRHGKFSEAAGYLQKQPSANQTRSFRVAWYYFLGHDEENAKAALMDTLPPQHMSEEVQLMTYYMAYRLLDDAAAYEHLVEHRDAIEELRWQADRFSKHPFGVRMSEIVEDLQVLLKIDGPGTEAS